MERWPALKRDLQRFSAGNNPDKDENNGHHQQNVDDAAYRVAGDEAQQPKNDENDGYGLKHNFPFISFPVNLMRRNRQ
jgi:hypothetical protein